MDEHKKPTIGFWAAVAAALVALAIYLAAYDVLVLPETHFYSPWMGHQDRVTVARYRWPRSRRAIESGLVQLLFEPLNRLDRKVRPERWPPDMHWQ